MKKYILILLAFLLAFCSSGSSSTEVEETVAAEETQATEEAVETVKEPTNSIWVSAKKGDIESIKQHIAYGTDLDSKGSRRNETALIIAACQGHYEIVEVLINAGADLDAKNDEDVTAQFCAVFFGRTEIVQLLSDSGADPNIVMNQDLTAMDLVSVEWNGERETAVKSRVNGSLSPIIIKILIIAATAEYLNIFTITNQVIISTINRGQEVANIKPI